VFLIDDKQNFSLNAKILMKATKHLSLNVETGEHLRLKDLFFKLKRLKNANKLTPPAVFWC